jgi:small-conductance mechanosensitive channel
MDILIPNESLLTGEITNWSYGDRNIRFRLPLQISYDDDPEQAMTLMEQAARASERVLADPEPVARLMGFGESGIDLELRLWVSDPENGVNNVRSDVYLRIWKDFKTAGITLPFPQRDVHLLKESVAPAISRSGDTRGNRAKSGRGRTRGPRATPKA